MMEIYECDYKSVVDFADYFGFPREVIHNLDFSKYLEYFDMKGLFIGITCDTDGIFWIPEVCSVPLDVCKSREEAQELAILECFKMIEKMSEFEIK